MKGSPWLDEVARDRPVDVLVEDDSADAVIIGGGVSGLATAYYLLKDSDRQVLLLEKDLVGHGATGHNGGQVVALFEKRYTELGRTMGEELTEEGYRELNDGWDLLRSMLEDIGSPELLQESNGQLGFSRPDELHAWIEEMEARRRIGISIGTLRLADDAHIAPPAGKEVELAYRDLIEDLLWSRDHRYLAAAETRVGIMNSYLLTERLAGWLLATYPGFRLKERSPVNVIRLSEEEAAVSCNGRTVFCDSVVLCTNGYQIPAVQACSPPAVQGKVAGVVGYMVGRCDEQGVPGVRVYYRGAREEVPYFYLTRRRYRNKWLIAAGGPQERLREGYDPEKTYIPKVYDRIESFLASTLQGYKGPREREWQGLMGYTPTGVRVAGQDPRLPTLYYNLGCNGIGLLSAVAGGKRVAEIMRGEEQAPSMFDPGRSIPEREAPTQRSR